MVPITTFGMLDQPVPGLGGRYGCVDLDNRCTKVPPVEDPFRATMWGEMGGACRSSTKYIDIFWLHLYVWACTRVQACACGCLHGCVYLWNCVWVCGWVCAARLCGPLCVYVCVAGWVMVCVCVSLCVREPSQGSPAPSAMSICRAKEPSGGIWGLRAGGNGATNPARLGSGGMDGRQNWGGESNKTYLTKIAKRLSAFQMFRSGGVCSLSHRFVQKISVNPGVNLNFWRLSARHLSHMSNPWNHFMKKIAS